MSQREIRAARRLRIARAKRLLPVISAISAGLSLTQFAQATRYSWTWNSAGNASGTWSVTTNWTPNLATATTINDAVFFPSAGVTADSTVVLGSPQIIGHQTASFPDNTLLFGDHFATGNASWTLNATGAAANDATNILTIDIAANTYETVEVGDLGPGKVATINATMSNGAVGGLSLAKAGVGTLVLTANNANLTGAFALNNGVLMEDYSQTWSPTNNILGDNGTAGATSSHLQGQGGTFIMKGKGGATNSQTFTNGTGLEFGASKISFVQNGATAINLNLGTLSRQVGAVMDVALPTIGAVTWAPGAAAGTYPAEPLGTVVGLNGLIVDTDGVPFATVNNGADWAADSAGNIVAASSIGGFYTASTATTLANNANLTTNVTLAANATIPSLRAADVTARTIDLGGANTLAVGGILQTPGAGNVTIQNGNLSANSSAANGDLTIFQAGGTTLTISANIVNPASGSAILVKTGAGTLILSGNNTYGGQGGGNTQVHGGTLVVAGGTTGQNPNPGNEANIEIAPAYADTATMMVTNGTVNARRVISGGNSGNNAGGRGTLIQTGGTINSGQWFSMGTQGNGTYLLSGGVMNQNVNGGTQMEIGVFGIGRGTVNLSGTGQMNIYSSGNITMGVFDTAGGVFNQNGGTVTFYSDAGITPGGTGNLVVGNDAGVSTYTLNSGVIKVGGITHGGTGQGFVNLNGGTIQAVRANATILGGGITATRIQAGGANIDTNGLTVTASAAMSHDAALGATLDGGLTKNGAGTMRLNGVCSYTGPTVINSGTLQLVNTAGVPSAVGNYTFDNVRNTSNVLVTSGPLGDNYTVVNGGSGGTTMNGTVNNSENLLGPGTAGGSIVPGRFGNALSLDGLGSSVDMNSQIVDQSGGGVSTMNIWVNTSTPGGVYVGKNAGGVTWAVGHSAFYLSTFDTNTNLHVPGGNPTAVRFAGGFERADSNVVDNAWHMLTFVDTGSGRMIYVDGVAAALLETGYDGGDTSTVTRLGRNIDSFANLDGTVDYAGLMDELKFYNVALTSQQITELFNNNAITTANTGGQFMSTTSGVNITASGAALDLNGVNQTIGSLAGVAGSLVTLGAGSLTTGGNNTSTTFAGVISGTGAVIKSGTGTMTLSGDNTYSGGTSVSGGTLIVTNSGSLGSGGISASNAAVLDISAGRSTAVKTPSLSITTGAAVDLRDNDMVISNTTPMSQIETYVKNARNNGAWNGSGLTSSNARTNASANTNLGVISGADYTSFGHTGTFSGQTYTATDTLVKYTWNGDTNFSGTVNFDDYVRVDVGFNTNLTGWSNGDFNYSGNVNFDDYVMIDVAFNTQSGTLSRAVNWVSGDDRSSAGTDAPGVQYVMEHLAEFGAPYGAAFLAAVPEPASLGLLSVAAASILLPRRRRQIDAGLPPVREA